MTSSRDRPNTALLVVDVQNDVVANTHHYDEVTANINTFIDRGSREQAEVSLARLKRSVGEGETPVGVRARSVRVACELYLAEARTESQTRRTDRSACHRICATALPGGSVAGEVALLKISWKLVERIFASWEGEIEPTTPFRYASTLSKVFEHAKRSGWIRSNPVAEARRPKVPSHPGEM